MGLVSRNKPAVAPRTQGAEIDARVGDTQPVAPIATEKRLAESTLPHLDDATRAKVLGGVVDKAPVRSGGNAGLHASRLLHQQVSARRGETSELSVELSIEDRKLLRTAYKELSRPGATLDDHLALRSLVESPRARAAFDEILVAHADKLLPELLDKAGVFAGAAALRELGDVASAMGKRAELDEHVVAQLEVARSWAKNDTERGFVLQTASVLGLSLSSTEVLPERVYEASAKHHVNARAGEFISPAPTDGQKVLDASVQVKVESPRRVGVDKDLAEYVVFDQTSEGTFHGHTRAWEQLHPDMQQALIDARLCTGNGRIL